MYGETFNPGDIARTVGSVSYEKLLELQQNGNNHVAQIPKTEGDQRAMGIRSLQLIKQALDVRVAEKAAET